MTKKVALCCWIGKNICRLLSPEFWWKTATDPSYQGMLYARMIVVTAAVDMFLMLVKPGYPE